MKKMIVLLTLLSIVAMGITQLSAQPRDRYDRGDCYNDQGKRSPRARHDRDLRRGPDNRRGSFHGNPEIFKERLNLSDDQITKIRDINKKYQLRLLDYKEKISPKNIQLKKLLLADNVNLKKVKSVLEEISKYRVELRMLRIEHRLEMEKVLTEKQRERLRTEMRSGRGMHRPHRWK